jgi:hypothetical protein
MQVASQLSATHSNDELDWFRRVFSAAWTACAWLCELYSIEGSGLRPHLFNMLCMQIVQFHPHSAHIQQHHYLPRAFRLLCSALVSTSRYIEAAPGLSAHRGYSLPPCAALRSWCRGIGQRRLRELIYKDGAVVGAAKALGEFTPALIRRCFPPDSC